MLRTNLVIDPELSVEDAKMDQGTPTPIYHVPGSPDGIWSDDDDDLLTEHGIPVLIADQKMLENSKLHPYRTIKFHRDQSKNLDQKKKTKERKREQKHHSAPGDEKLSLDQKSEKTFYPWQRLPSEMQEYTAKFCGLFTQAKLSESSRSDCDSTKDNLLNDWFPDLYEALTSTNDKVNFSEEFKKRFTTCLELPTLFIAFKEGNLEKIKKGFINIANIFLIKDKEGKSLIQYAETHRQTILNYFYTQALAYFPMHENIDYQLNKPLWNTTLLYWAACFNQIDTVEKILSLPDIDVNVRSSSGETPLFIASYMGNDDIVELLVERTANIDSKTESNTTPLNMTIACGLHSTAKLLLEHNASINISYTNGRTPLHQSKNVNMTELLINHKANLDSIDAYNFTPLCYAAQHNNMKMVQALLKAGAKPISDDTDTLFENPVDCTSNVYIKEVLLLAQLDYCHRLKIEWIKTEYPDTPDYLKLKEIILTNNLEHLEKIYNPSSNPRLPFDIFCFQIKKLLESKKKMVEDEKPRNTMR